MAAPDAGPRERGFRKRGSPEPGGESLGAASSDPQASSSASNGSASNGPASSGSASGKVEASGVTGAGFDAPGWREVRASRGSLRAALCAVLLLACAGGGGGDEKASKLPIPADSSLAQVEKGMDDEQVRKIMGSPDGSRSYVTGKGFIPYYYGPDTRRTAWLYNGTGRVIFSRNQYTGGLKVINRIYDPETRAE